MDMIWHGYDPLGRLSEVSRNGELLRRYWYDAFGNRISLREGTKTTEYTYNVLNQLTEENAGEGLQRIYRYDKRGNLSEVKENGETVDQYLYGALNRLEQSANGMGKGARYEYNGLDYRVGKKEGSLLDARCLEEKLDPVRQIQEQEIHVLREI